LIQEISKQQWLRESVEALSGDSKSISGALICSDGKGSFELEEGGGRTISSQGESR